MDLRLDAVRPSLQCRSAGATLSVRTVRAQAAPIFQRQIVKRPPSRVANLAVSYVQRARVRMRRQRDIEQGPLSAPCRWPSASPTSASSSCKKGAEPVPPVRPRQDPSRRPRRSATKSRLPLAQLRDVDTRGVAAARGKRSPLWLRIAEPYRLKRYGQIPVKFWRQTTNDELGSMVPGALCVRVRRQTEAGIGIGGAKPPDPHSIRFESRSISIKVYSRSR